MKCSIVDIHTHRPTGKALEPSFAGIHPWQAETRRIEEIVPRFAKSIWSARSAWTMPHGRPGGPAPDFREQLDWAERLGKPVVLHCVKAFEAVMRRTGSPCTAGGDLPRFIGSSQQAAEAIKKGYYLSFGERTKVLLAALFLRDDAYPLIDEPTNTWIWRGGESWHRI